MRGTYDPGIYSWPKTTTKPPSVACIAGDPGRSRCGRDLDVREYVFTDADYTIATRENDLHLQPCGMCVERVRAKQELERASR
jgi:hypothetical protein